MVDFSEDESLPAIAPSRLDLFMTVIRVASWPTTVRWYIDTLGLPPIVMDAQHEFALLFVGQCRIELMDPAMEADLMALANDSPLFIRVQKGGGRDGMAARLLAIGAIEKCCG